MQIKTKYSLGDEVYIIDEDNIIFKAYIDEIDFSINTEDGGETLYDVKVERPVGLNRIDIEDELCLLEDEIFSSLTIAEKAVNNNKKIKEEEREQEEKEREQLQNLSFKYDNVTYGEYTLTPIQKNILSRAIDNHLN